MQAWCPYLQKDIKSLEKVQRRATKSVPSLRERSYEERLKELNLYPLEVRRARGDVIETFKILNGFEDMDASELFTLSDAITRVHMKKIYKKRLMKGLNLRKFFFSQRVVDNWNNLPEYVISAKTVNQFKKLECYGFRGVVSEWFKNYLNNRNQMFFHNNCKSDLKDIVCGIPHGSILGPLLFILYVNDIIYTSNVLNFILFADGNTILYSHKDLSSSIINEELKEVSNWFKANKLSVNDSKTNYMILGTPHMTSRKTSDNSNIVLNDTILERVKVTKFLGVLNDECLT